MNLSDKLRAMMKHRGNLGVNKLAEISDVSASIISDILNNPNYKPRIDTIERLAKALDVEPGYFFKSAARTILDVQQVIDKLPKELLQFVMDLDNMPWLVLGKNAKDGNISVETAQKIIDLLQREKEENESKKPE